MLNSDHDKLVSDQTQAIFQALVARGSDLVGLLALVSSAYADGGHHVLDQLHEKMRAESEEPGTIWAAE